MTYAEWQVFHAATAVMLGRQYGFISHTYIKLRGTFSDFDYALDPDTLEPLTGEEVTMRRDTNISTQIWREQHGSYFAK